MALAPMGGLLREARGALAYCESWNLESLQAVVAAAEECRLPVIAGFNGGLLGHAEDLHWYSGFRCALEAASVPAVLFLNESVDLEQIRQAIDLGFNAVMPDNEGPDVVREVVALAHPREVWVEAQLGSLASGVDPAHPAGSTDPEAAARFVETTGVDALAVAVGNVHVLTEGNARLDLDRLAAIAARVPVPLVLHGGTGIGDADLCEAIRIGVAKVNFGTVLKQAYLDAIAAALRPYRRPLNPHEFLGAGGPADILTAGREAVKREALRLMRLCDAPRRQSGAS